MTRAAVARRMALCCRHLAARGLLAGRDGNLSVRLSADRVLVTPSGVVKALVAPRDMVEVDLAGRSRGAPRSGRRRKPTSELDLHLRILRHRPDVHAVVHAHPPAATGFAVAGEEIPPNVLAELIFVVGRAPIVPFGMPGTPELGDGLVPYLPGHNALLLANHGAVTLGTTLDEAWIRMESLEHAARIVLAARAAAPHGGTRPLDPAVVRRLEEAALRERNG